MIVGFYKIMSTIGLNSIKNKLMMGFVPVILLMFTVILYANSNYHALLNEYDKSLQNFEILNEFFSNNSKVQSTLQSYILTGSKKELEEYGEKFELSWSLVDKLIGNAEDELAASRVSDLKNMLQTYSEKVEQSVGFLNIKEKEKAYKLFNEATRINQLIDSTFKRYFSAQLDFSQKHRNYLLKRISNQAIFNNLISSLTVVFCIIFVLIFSRGISRPISKLVKNAELISKGSFDINAVDVKSKDELFILSGAFNNMAASLKFYIGEMENKANLQMKLYEEENENLRIKSLLRETQLKALQAQMNPHFLFNTLNIISRTAYIEEAGLTLKLLEATTELLRYNLDKANKAVTLEEEISCMNDYIYIQRKRFGERILFNVLLEDSLENIMMPSLIIQPLIENAIIHGVEDYIKDARINIYIAKISDFILIRVIDNGVGMDKEKIADLIQEDTGEWSLEEEGKKGSIGIRSVKKRLELFFSLTSLLKIDSTVNEGTAITLKLPIGTNYKGVILNVQNPDS